MDYLGIYYFVSKYLGFFRLISVFDFQFHFTLIRENTLRDFNPFKFIEICFMTKVILVDVCMHWKRMWILLLGATSYKSQLGEVG